MLLSWDCIIKKLWKKLPDLQFNSRSNEPSVQMAGQYLLIPYLTAVYCTVSLSLQSVLPMDPDPRLFVNQEQYFQPTRLDPDTNPHWNQCWSTTSVADAYHIYVCTAQSLKTNILSGKITIFISVTKAWLENKDMTLAPFSVFRFVMVFVIKGSGFCPSMYR
jgi:hypothetical protein